MQISKLDATGSTNKHLKELLGKQELTDYSVISAIKQSCGKGQRGAYWEAEPGKNLTFSMLKMNIGLPVLDSFWINVYVSMALYKVLRALKVPGLKIKWPNDIMAGDKKLGGILIENSVMGSTINNAIIGVGLNINQTIYQKAPNAVSLKMLFGQSYDLDALMQTFAKALQEQLQILPNRDTVVWRNFETHLYQKGVLHKFYGTEGNTFTARIIGVCENGSLLLQHQDGNEYAYNLQEVKMYFETLDGC